MATEQAPSRATRERRTDYVVLAVLQQGPSTGYGVRKRIAESVGNFWQESFGQLYPALRALTAKGLVCARSASIGKRSAEEFSITAQGTRVLRDWVRREPRIEPERNELLLKLFLTNLDPEAVVRHVEAKRKRALSEKARLDHILAELSKVYTDSPSLPAWCSTVDYGIAMETATLAWCARTLERLTKAAHPAIKTRLKRSQKRSGGNARNC
jgi:DNA-binding PadR family transcriptional regulator